MTYPNVRLKRRNKISTALKHITEEIIRAIETARPKKLLCLDIGKITCTQKRFEGILAIVTARIRKEFPKGGSINEREKEYLTWLIDEGMRLASRHIHRKTIIPMEESMRNTWEEMIYTKDVLYLKDEFQYSLIEQEKEKLEQALSGMLVIADKSAVTKNMKKIVPLAAKEDELTKKVAKTISPETVEWLEDVLALGDGKRTLFQIHSILEKRGFSLSADILITDFSVLKKAGYVTFRKVLKKEDFTALLKKAGIKTGDFIFVHSSLTRFGYVKGGENSVIDALLTLVGKNGTIAMPAFSFCWLGRGIYDRKSSKVRVGAVPNEFLRRQGVFRSNHPTHSVSAKGRKAKEFVSGHTYNSPVFSNQGPWGKLYDWNAWILMLCDSGPNTTLHAGEFWGGVPYPDFMGLIREKGRTKKVKIRNSPWHSPTQLPYVSMRREKTLREIKIGENSAYLMRTKDLIDETVRIVEKRPLVAIPENCHCEYCRYVRKNV